MLSSANQGPGPEGADQWGASKLSIVPVPNVHCLVISNNGRYFWEIFLQYGFIIQLTIKFDGKESIRHSEREEFAGI